MPSRFYPAVKLSALVRGHPARVLVALCLDATDEEAFRLQGSSLRRNNAFSLRGKGQWGTESEDISWR
jgi:hypothetical protein